MHNQMTDRGQAIGVRRGRRASGSGEGQDVAAPPAGTIQPPRRDHLAGRGVTG
jgi:hypothetical protein